MTRRLIALPLANAQPISCSDAPHATPTSHGAAPDAWDCFVTLGLANDLLPIVSNPQATLSPYSSLKMLGKVPSEYNERREVRGLMNWPAHESTAADIDRWKKEPDYGIGIQTRQIRAIDVDVEDKDEATAVMERIDALLARRGIRLPRRVRGSSSKFLMPLEITGRMSKRRFKTRSGGYIEFLADGQHFVAAGRHPSGVHYEWIDGLPLAIPSMPVAWLDELWFELRTAFEDTPQQSADARIIGAPPGDVRTRQRGETLDVRDDLAEFLMKANQVVRANGSLGLVLRCPWDDEHTTGQAGDGSTMYLRAGTNGYLRGHFKCMHSHCEARTDAEFASALGFDQATADFGDLDDGDITTVGAKEAYPEPVAPNVFTPGAWVDIAQAFLRQELGGAACPTVCRWQGTWYRYTGRHWAELQRDELEANVHNYLAAAKKPGKVTRGASGSLVPFWPTEKNMREVVHALSSRLLLKADSAPAWTQSGLLRDVRRPEWAPEDTISMSNGLFHLPSRQLEPHHASFFCLDSLPFSYDAEAPCPAWQSFLADVWPDDQQSRDTLQEFFGYILSNDTSMQKILYLYGAKRGGKGTIGTVMRALIGSSNVAAPTISSLATPFGVAPLIGKRAAIIGDARGGGRDVQQAVERLLTISGQDLQTIDRKHREPWHGRLGTRFVIMSNEVLSLPDSSGAMAARLLMIKFTQSFEGKEDSGLAERLLHELPGIFNWALAGLSRLMSRKRFIQPASAHEELAELKDMNSPVGLFVQQHCQLGVGLRVSKDDLYMRYRGFCSNEGRQPFPKAVFLAALYAACPSAKSRRPAGGDGDGRVHVVDGLNLVPLPELDFADT